MISTPPDFQGANSDGDRFMCWVCGNRLASIACFTDTSDVRPTRRVPVPLGVPVVWTYLGRKTASPPCGLGNRLWFSFLSLASCCLFCRLSWGLSVSLDLPV